MDYGKWDKLAAEISDSDDEDKSTPKVTAFEKKGGESIEIGPSGFRVKEKQEESTEASKTMKNLSDLELRTKNGGSMQGYDWGQNRYEVNLYFPIQSSSKGKTLKVTFLKNRLSIFDNESKIEYLNRELQYGIETDDSETSQGLDWELKSFGDMRCVSLTLRKKCPIPGAFIWWKNVFKGEPEIDVTKIEGRNLDRQTLDNFAEANRQFQERIGKREKIEVDL